MKFLMGIAALLFSTQLLANDAMIKAVQPDFRAVAAHGLVDWTVGDYADYNVDLGIASGTMQMLIREQVKDNFWINQQLVINGNEQLVEILVNPATGEILQMIVNGEEKEVPENPEMEIIATENEDVTVPAGTFATMHITMQETGTDKVTDSWINQTEIPVSGMVKTIQPSQFGKVTIDLTGYGRG